MDTNKTTKYEALKIDYDKIFAQDKYETIVEQESQNKVFNGWPKEDVLNDIPLIKRYIDSYKETKQRRHPKNVVKLAKKKAIASKNILNPVSVLFYKYSSL